MQHAWKHVERPGGSHTALDEKKSVGFCFKHSKQAGQCDRIELRDWMARDERLCFGKRSIKDHGNQHLASFENRLASSLHLMQDGEDLVLRCQGLPAERQRDKKKMLVLSAQGLWNLVTEKNVNFFFPSNAVWLPPGRSTCFQACCMWD